MLEAALGILSELYKRPIKHHALPLDSVEFIDTWKSTHSQAVDCSSFSGVEHQCLHATVVIERNGRI